MFPVRRIRAGSVAPGSFCPRANCRKDGLHRVRLLPWHPEVEALSTGFVADGKLRGGIAMSLADLRSSCLLLVVLLASPLLAGDPPQYEVLDLGTLGGVRSEAHAINNLGEVVGVARDHLGREQPFVWDRERGMRPLPTLGLGYGGARDVNDVGQVVGYARSSFPSALYHAVLWEGGEAYDLGRLGDISLGGSEVEALAVNNRGRIVGSSAIGFVDHAFFYGRTSGMLELAGSPWASDINDGGQIVGGRTLWEGLVASEPFLDEDSPYRYVRAHAINQRGQVAGVVGDIEANDDYTHAFFWDPADGLVDLGVLGSPDPEGMFYGHARDLNDSGLVVGFSDGPGIPGAWHAFLWTDEGGMVDLNTLLPPGSGWQSLEQAYGVNRLGQIVGIGLRDDGERHAFLLSPVHRTYYVDQDATGAGDGSTWSDASVTLQGALAVAEDGDEIRVAEGTYLPDQGPAVTEGDRRSTFLLQGAFSVRGGYAGVGSPEPDARDPATWQTVLSGDLARDDTTTAGEGRSDNAYHVVTLDGDVILDGFIIEGGQADGNATADSPEVARKGGGIHSRSGYSRVRNSTLRRNRAEGPEGSWGGGLCAAHGSLLSVEDCRFEDNSARWGGGLYGGFHRLERCWFLRNSAGSLGGAVAPGDGHGSLIISACRFLGNSAGGAGGALYILDQSVGPRVSNSLFSGNRALNRGGAIYCDESAPVFLNCTVAGNLAPDIGGGCFTSYSGTTIRNSIFAQNPGGSLCQDGALETDVSYSLIESSAPWPGEGNIQGDPLFVRSPAWDDAGTPEDPSDDVWEEGDLHLRPESPCRDAGTSDGAPETDLEGTRRPVGPGVDIGAFEYPTSVEPYFLRGDSNADGTVELSDAIRILDYLFLGGRVLDCADAADATDDGAVDVSDVVADLGFLFLGWSEPPLPGPDQCGIDPTDDDLGCESYPACR